MAVMIAGGAGFVGSHLVDACVAAGDEVVVFDDLSTGKLANLAGALDSGRATFVYQDVAVSKAKLAAALARANCGPIATIFHLASPERVLGDEAWATLAVNGSGTMALIDLALEFGARFVFASASSARRDEGKCFGEALTAAAVRERGLDGHIVRFSECYGPRMDLGQMHLVPALLAAARKGTPFTLAGAESQPRPLTYVDDAVAGLLGVCEREPAGERAITLACEEHAVQDVARTFVEATGVSLEIVHDCVGSVELPMKSSAGGVPVLAWSANVSLAEGLRRTYAWCATDALAFA
jgi:nucleoside-diphosphate-sugar epimerase